MAGTYFYIIAASLITSIVSLVGAVVLMISPKRLNRIIMLLVSLSAGTLLGDSFFHLLPEAVVTANGSSSIWIGIIGGILLFFVLEKIIHWRHCHVQPGTNHVHPVGIMNLLGDGLHNLLDGMLIAASFLVNTGLGVVTTIAVISHEIPQELGDFGTLLHAGFKPVKALWLNLLTGLASVAGAILAIIIGTHSEKFLEYVIPVTAGGFIYIATSDLIPELKKDSRLTDTLRQLFGIFLGLGIMVLLKVINE